MLANAPEITVNDAAAWQSIKESNQDPCGQILLAYTERWARLMQLKIAAGNTLEDVAEMTSQQADPTDVTNVMYSIAVHLLSSYWKYGEQLHSWHNQRYGARENTRCIIIPSNPRDAH